jgi:hypothetical protein
MSWAAVALGVRVLQPDAMRSRLPAYLHPVAGRSLAWHLLRACAQVRPEPATLLFLHHPVAPPPALLGLPAQVRPWSADLHVRDLATLLPAEVDRLILLEGAAFLEPVALGSLLCAPGGGALFDGDTPIAACITRGSAASMEMPLDLARIVAGLPTAAVAAGAAFAVRDRATLARAARLIRDRLVAALMEGGATFLLPDSVTVDVDVSIGADAVVYPGVVLEGQTTIGPEAVIGPGCRVIDSHIGRGAELKGFNYIAGTTVRNRAVLEPYVRRGFD